MPGVSSPFDAGLFRSAMTMKTLLSDGFGQKNNLYQLINFPSQSDELLFIDIRNRY